MSLKTAASLVLAIPFPATLLWGPEFTIAAYNDAYRRVLGSKPEALGRPLLQVWEEARDALAPQLARALAGEAVTVEGARYVILRGGGQEPEEAWFDYTFSPVRDEEGRICGVLNLGVETTTRVRAEAARQSSEGRWREVFERMGEGFEINEMVLDPDGQAVDFVYVDVNAAWERQSGFPREAVVGRRATEVFPRAETDYWVPLFGRVAETGEPVQVERYFAPASRWIEVIVYRLEPRRVAVLLRDVTERHRAAERQALLSREVDHRAKNALSVVQAALRLTRAPDLPSYMRAIEGRVAAIARAQTLLADDQWSSADLLTLLRGELDGLLDRHDGRVEVEGPAVALPPGSAQPFAMAIHELTTNALKHGALSNPTGRIAVTWSVEGGQTGRLRLRWAEEGGPPVEGPPERRGFGARVLDGTVRSQLGGALSLTWPRSGLTCEIDLPLEP
ncbi:PAS domain-containing protein [Muricoccus nepalensis]|uniref:PAS domain-containing protein n=1 Tax=Muricoccus nepalensis TaxID=1854500 RepID=UPI001386E75B|nr:PAS domain-containing protein [Roseomonas nepalensis]